MMICFLSKGNKSKNKLLVLYQNKKLLHSEGNNQQNQRQPTEWEKIFVNDISNKELVSKIYKELIQLDSPKQNTTQLKMGRLHEQTFLQRRHTDSQ